MSKIKKLMASLLAVAMIGSLGTNVFASESNESTGKDSIVKTPISIVEEEWTDMGQDKPEFYMVGATISNEAESNNSVGLADTISLSIGRKGKIANSTDVDFYKFTPTSSGKYRFDLIDIPSSKDFDLYLYDTNQNLVASSLKSSQSFETIVASLSSNAAYYLKVVGYNSAFSATEDYMITVTNDALALLNYDYPFRGTNPYRNISANYGYYDGSSVVHYGLDISQCNLADLYSVGTGSVAYKGWSNSAGNYISLNISNVAPGQTAAYVTYMHMNAASPLSNGNSVTSTTIVGNVGSTGNSSGPHLHLQINNTANWANQNHSGTNNPLRYFTNINFTGLAEDLVEYSIQPTDNSVYKDELAPGMYMIDSALIDYVGEDNFTTWVDSLNNDEIVTIADFLNDFSVSDEEFISIYNANAYFSDIYNLSEVLAMR